MDIMSAYWRYHTPKGGDPTPHSSPLNAFASPYGREDAIIHLLDSVWPLSTGLSWSFPMARSVASCPPTLVAGRSGP